MARGVATVAESREKAEAQIETNKHGLRIKSCREIDLSGLPPLRSGPVPRHWVIVVEDTDPELAAERPQHDDPEGECERQVRQTYLALGTDPDLLITGSSEAFPCPNCGEEIKLELPPPRQKPHPGHTSCPKCRAHLQLSASSEGRWAVAPPSPKRSGVCIFCGDKANSQEHVIPAWISKRLGIKQIIPMENSIQSRRNPRRRPISFSSYRAPIFCKTCNTHFKHLEDEVVDLIVPMARGLALSLGPATQKVLALWSVKTAIALMSAEPGDQDAVPLEHRQALRDHAEIAADTWVGIFHWHGDPVIMTGDGVAPDKKQPGHFRQAYGSMLAFEGFGFYVTAFTEPIGPDVKLCGDRPPMLSIWPPRTGMSNWPPPMTDNRVLPRNLVAGWTPLEDA